MPCQKMLLSCLLKVVKAVCFCFALRTSNCCYFKAGFYSLEGNYHIHDSFWEFCSVQCSGSLSYSQEVIWQFSPACACFLKRRRNQRWQQRWRRWRCRWWQVFLSAKLKGHLERTNFGFMATVHSKLKCLASLPILPPLAGLRMSLEQQQQRCVREE